MSSCQSRRASHTPGPWRAVPVNSGNSAFYIKGTQQNGEPETMGVGAVAIIPRSTVKPLEANAALIAAAPRLLSALVALVNHKGEFRDGSALDLWANAFEAIDQAGGAK